MPPEPAREETIRRAAESLRSQGWSVTCGNIHGRDFITVREPGVVLFESEDPAVCYVWQDGEVVGRGMRNSALRVVDWLLVQHDETADRAGGHP
jgi:hypothetical protein